MVPTIQYLYSFLVGTGILALQLSGFVLAGHAVMTNRTTQGTIAWALMLSIFPYLGVPLYLVFGINRFEAYVQARRRVNEDLQGIHERSFPTFLSERDVKGLNPKDRHTIEKLAKSPFSYGNHAELLVNGDATFESIFTGIREAKNYVLIQFFTIIDDELGRQLKQVLLDAAARGVRVYLLYDSIGSRKLTRSYLKDLHAGGVQAVPFRTGRGWRGRTRLNFRNHRKIVVVDGKRCWTGGHNVSNTYISKNPKFGHWRDTHIVLEGPAVSGGQLAFCEDWYWETRELPEVDWPMPPEKPTGWEALVLTTGPADKRETCSLTFLQLIQMAKERIWIHSPYFVPDEQMVTALELAALRGVDVRILLPEKPDHVLVWLSSFYFIALPQLADVKIHRYQPGFLHSKVMLVDDYLSSVGTINFDNRSFRINFEMTALVANPSFARRVEEMMAEDFRQSRIVEPTEYLRRPLYFRIAVRVARLLAPLQ